MLVNSSLAAVGRPVGTVVERRVVELDAAQDVALLVADDQPVLAAVVVEPGDALAVGRPAGVAVGDAGGAGDVAPAPVLRRDREQVAPILEDGPLARGGEAGVGELRRGHVLPARARPVLVGLGVHHELLVLARLRVQDVQVARLLVDHHAVAGAQPLHVEVGVVGELLLLLRARIVRPHVHRVVALGEVVDHAVHPRRVHLALTLPRRRLQVQGRQVHHADGLGLAAPVVPELGVPVLDLLIGEHGAVVAHPAQEGLVHREHLGPAAGAGDGVELPQPRLRARAPRLEDDPAVGGPPLDHVGVRDARSAAGAGLPRPPPRRRPRSLRTRR